MLRQEVFDSGNSKPQHLRHSGRRSWGCGSIGAAVGWSGCCRRRNARCTGGCRCWCSDGSRWRFPVLGRANECQVPSTRNTVPAARSPVGGEWRRDVGGRDGIQRRTAISRPTAPWRGTIATPRTGTSRQRSPGRRARTAAAAAPSDTPYAADRTSTVRANGSSVAFAISAPIIAPTAAPIVAPHAPPSSAPCQAETGPRLTSRRVTHPPRHGHGRDVAVDLDVQGVRGSGAEPPAQLLRGARSGEQRE